MTRTRFASINFFAVTSFLNARVLEWHCIIEVMVGVMVGDRGILSPLVVEWSGGIYEWTSAFGKPGKGMFLTPPSPCFCKISP